ncbi:MAG: formylglycine-generating enzyme family protein [Planctomycetaceae bacterium]|nr:formylglycine-generating enzyme family protein [Planctomycetaceae bacterium]
MRRITFNNNGILALAAWVLLAVAVLAVYRTESLRRFCNDFFATDFSAAHHQSVYPINFVQNRNRKDAFNTAGFDFGFEKYPDAVIADTAAIYASNYSGRYSESETSDNRLMTTGTILSGEELPQLKHTEQKNEPAIISRIKNRSELDAAAPMVSLSGGTFQMGDDAGERDQRPVHTVQVLPFRLDKHHVTNRQFKMFVEQTHYRTDAEQRGWSYVFDFKRKCWIRMAGANWKNTTGTINEDLSAQIAMPANEDLPVVHVSWNDAQRFCQWAGKRLPTEAEWEYAARAGRKDVMYSWGGSVSASPAANFWQGWFPDENTQKDGFLLLSPVTAFAPNPFGLNDMGGNAWQWCSDRYAADYYGRSPLFNPQGPSWESSETVAVPNVVLKRENGRIIAEEFGGVKNEALRVIRGGSFLSSENNDAGYRVSARGCQPESLSFQDVGFRCAEGL